MSVRHNVAVPQHLRCLKGDEAVTAPHEKNMNKIATRIVFLISFIFAIFCTLSIAQPVKHPTNALDKGDFKVGFSPTTKAKQPNKAMPKEDRDILQGIADALNGFIALPRNVYLNFDECGEANAFYSPGTSEITICYELIGQFESEFKKVSKDPAAVEAMVDDTLVQTLFHELGHCLIDVWDLPATGREEDAVDQLATIIMLDGTPEGQRSTINAALEFKIASAEQTKDDLLFWDEHSFSQTRFYDMLCLVYGSDPKKNAGLVGPDLLPQERARRCPAEYQRANHAWERLLTPYIVK